MSGEGPEWRHAAEVRSWGLTDVGCEGGEGDAEVSGLVAIWLAEAIM